MCYERLLWKSLTRQAEKRDEIKELIERTEASVQVTRPTPTLEANRRRENEVETEVETV